MGKPVLIVEDQADVRSMIATLLTFQGYEVKTASDGQEALRSARRNKPALIVLDLMMPVMDGEAFRREQLADPELADIPVICVSARPDLAEVSIRLNPAATLQKPLVFHELADTVRRICGAPSIAPPSV